MDRDYLINSILNPDAERTLKFKDMVMPPLGLTPEMAADMADYILGL